MSHHESVYGKRRLAVDTLLLHEARYLCLRKVGYTTVTVKSCVGRQIEAREVRSES
jgi:hypothetical protein